jgi:hypothetical protein
MCNKTPMALTIAAILIAYIAALTLSNQAFAQSGAGQEAKQFPGGQLPPGFNPGGPIKPVGPINPGGPILITCIVGKGCIERHV